MPRALSATRLRRRLLVIKKELRAQFSEFKMFLDSKEAWFACVNNGDVEAVRYNLPTYQKSVDRQGKLHSCTPSGTVTLKWFVF